MTTPLNARPVPDPKTRADLVSQPETGSAISSPFGSWSLQYDDGLGAAPTLEQLGAMVDRLDGKASMLEQALTLPLRGAVPNFTAPPNDQGQTAWVVEHLTRPSNAGGMSTPLDLVIGQMTAATWQRRAYFEKVWVPVDGGTRVGYGKIAWRPAQTCVLKRDVRTGAYRGFSQTVPKVDANDRITGTETITLPPARSFVYIHGQHRNPLWGVGDLDFAWTCSETKRKIKFLWLKFLENVSFPSGLMYTDHESSDTANLNAAARRAASLRSGGILPLAKGEKLEGYDSNGQGADQFMAALDWLSSEQAMSVLEGLGDLTSASKSGGSYALGETVDDRFTRGRDTVLREMAATITNYVVADLVRWNFGAQTAAPAMHFAPLRDAQTGTIVSLVESLAGSRQGQGGGTDSGVPREFIEELTLKLAAHLELDVDRIRKALSPDTAGPTVDAPPDLAPAATAVDRATRLVLAHDAAQAARTA